MGKVNLGELIARAAVSNLDTGREQIEYIPLERIHQDPNNFYSLEGWRNWRPISSCVGSSSPSGCGPGG